MPRELANQPTVVKISANSRKVIKRLVRGIGIFLICLLLVSAVWYLREVYLCSKLRLTGNDLFDTYANYLIAEQQWRLFHHGRRRPSHLSKRRMDLLEQHFGNNPEYWQLAYWNTLQELPDDNFFGSEEGEYEEVHRKATTYLDRAVKQGTADTSIFALRYLEASRPLFRDLTSEEKANRKLRISQTWDSWHSSQPDSAWPYYVQTMQYAAHGKYEQAYQTLLMGDAATSKTAPGCFPISLVRDRLSLDTYGTSQENPVLTGVLLFGDDIPELASLYGIDRDKGGFAKWLRQQRHTDGLVAYYQLGLTLGRVRYADWFLPLESDMVVRSALNNYLASEQILNEDQRWLVLMALNRTTHLAKDYGSWVSLVIDRNHYLENWNIVGVSSEGGPAEPEQVISPFLSFVTHLWLCNTPAGDRLRTSLELTRTLNLRHGWFVYRQLSLIDLKNPRLPKEWVDIGAYRDGFPTRSEPIDYDQLSSGWSSSDSL